MRIIFCNLARLIVGYYSFDLKFFHKSGIINVVLLLLKPLLLLFACFLDDLIFAIILLARFLFLFHIQFLNICFEMMKRFRIYAFLVVCFVDVFSIVKLNSLIIFVALLASYYFGWMYSLSSFSFEI